MGKLKESLSAEEYENLGCPHDDDAGYPGPDERDYAAEAFIAPEERERITVKFESDLEQMLSVFANLNPATLTNNDLLTLLRDYGRACSARAILSSCQLIHEYSEDPQATEAQAAAIRFAALKLSGFAHCFRGKVAGQQQQPEKAMNYHEQELEAQRRHFVHAHTKVQAYLPDGWDTDVPMQVDKFFEDGSVLAVAGYNGETVSLHADAFDIIHPPFAHPSDEGAFGYYIGNPAMMIECVGPQSIELGHGHVGLRPLEKLQVQGKSFEVDREPGNGIEGDEYEFVGRQIGQRNYLICSRLDDDGNEHRVRVRRDLVVISWHDLVISGGEQA